MIFWGRRSWGGWLAVLLMFAFIRPVWAGELPASLEGESPAETGEAGAAGEEETVPAAGLDTAEELLEDLELSQIQELMDEMLENSGFSLKETVARLMNGGEIFSAETLRLLIKDALFSQLARERELMLQIFLLLIAAAVFTNLARVFDNGQIGEISFYAVYLLLFLLLAESFQTLSLQLTANLDTITSFMNALAPAYFLVVAASTGSSTAAMFYQVVLVLSGLIQWVMLVFLLPGTNLYVLLQLVNHLSKEPILSKLADFLRTLIEWALKSMLGVVVGMQVVQGLISPVIDSLKRTAIGKTAGAIPGVGGAINAVTEIVLSSAVLVRNCLGVTFLIAFLLWGLTPMVKYGVNTLLYRLIAAVSQPISDKRIVGCLTTMGDGCGLLLRILLTTQVLCMLTVVILAVTFGGNG